MLRPQVFHEEDLGAGTIVGRFHETLDVELPLELKEAVR
jgi:hypothetical protein